jgi:hypothetical protein
MSHENNTSTLDTRLSIVERAIEGFYELQRGQIEINGRLEKTIALLQQSHLDFTQRYERDRKRCETECVEPLKTLRDEQNKVKGGTVILVGLVGMLLGGGGMGAIIIEIIKHSK